MNERIKQLMDQAGIDVEAVESLGEMPTALKFAELIVKQCVHCVLNGKLDEEEFNPNDEFHRGHNIALDNTAEGLSQYFGVPHAKQV